ncbi:hypothetical protein M5D96_008183, partial [Drosophila gunungcola]
MVLRLIGQERGLVKVLQRFTVRDPLVTRLIWIDHKVLVGVEHVHESIEEDLSHRVIDAQVLVVLIHGAQLLFLTPPSGDWHCGVHCVHVVVYADRRGRERDCGTAHRRASSPYTSLPAQKVSDAWHVIDPRRMCNQRLVVHDTTAWRSRQRIYRLLQLLKTLLATASSLQTSGQSAAGDHGIYSSWSATTIAARPSSSSPAHIAVPKTGLLVAVPLNLELVQHRTNLRHKVHFVWKDWKLLGQLDVFLVDIHKAKRCLAADLVSSLAFGMQSHYKGHWCIQEVVQGCWQYRSVDMWPHKRKQQRSNALAHDHKSLVV